MTKIVTFATTVSKQGDRLRLIIIPKRLHPRIEKYVRMQVKVTLEVLEE
jgi:hypothetical protein